MEFSIVIPVYNVENYLMECCQSVVKQDFHDYEVILVNDGSTDSSYEICKGLCSKYVNFNLYNQENKGLSEARNIGIRHSKGDYIVLLDSDDLLADHALYNLNKVIKKYDFPDFIISRRQELLDGSDKVCDCQYYFDSERYLAMRRSEIYEDLQSLRDCWLGAWIFTVKRQDILDNNLFFYPGILHEDEEWVPKVFFTLSTVGFNNSPLTCNRVNRKGSITATANIKRLFDRLKVVDLLNDEFSSGKYDYDAITSVEHREYSIIFGVLCDAWLYKNNAKFPEIQEKLRQKVRLLKKSNKKSHHLAYLCYKILGMKNTEKILFKIKNE